MSNVLALIPARSGSKGIPDKNVLPLVGMSPTKRALECAFAGGCNHIVLSTDQILEGVWLEPFEYLLRPTALAQDDTPMIDVVKHALQEIPGPPEQIVLLLQPTQPLREPRHLIAAIALLEEQQVTKGQPHFASVCYRPDGSIVPGPPAPDRVWQCDSVVSVTEIPRTYHPAWQFTVEGGRLYQWPVDDDRPERRQELEPTYVRDGTVYAFWRKTVDQYGTIYGQDVRPLVIPAEETCALDTPADWAEAERRLRERDAS